MTDLSPRLGHFNPSHAPNGIRYVKKERERKRRQKIKTETKWSSTATFRLLRDGRSGRLHVILDTMEIKKIHRNWSLNLKSTELSTKITNEEGQRFKP